LIKIISSCQKIISNYWDICRK